MLRKHIRNIISAAIVILVFSAFAAYADVEYKGSRKSDKYHFATCRYVKTIKEKNLITFNSVKEAIDAGYFPCKVCAPPQEDKPKSENK
jgi:methylphosphotriester-DNA--protein-cysteine methyltransferase